MDINTLQERWGLNLPQGQEVAQYLTYVGSTFVDSTLRLTFAAGGGFIATR